MQKALRATVFSNRGLLLPRHLDEFGQTEADVFLRFIKTMDVAESETWGAKLADEGLGIESLMALVSALNQGCFDLLETEDQDTIRATFKAMGIHINSLFTSFYVAIEESIRREQTGISRALHQTFVEKLQQTQARLVHSEKLSSLGRLTASIAHELSTPITGLRLYFQHTLSRTSATDPEREYLRIGARYVERMAGLLKYLQDFSKPPQSERTSVMINQVLEEVLTFSHRQLEGTGVEVIRDFAPDLPPIVASASQLEQVFINLVINAADSMPDGGKLRVSTRHNERKVIIEFADTGEGISPEDLNRIFEPFFTTKEHSGTGLGLAISYRIVEEHGGSIDVESKLGEGTIFRIRLPVQGER